MTTDRHTFSGDASTTDPFRHQGRYSQLTIGEITAEDFGGGTLYIQKSTLNGSKHTIRRITSAEFSLMQDRTLRLELPDRTDIFMTLTGSTAPDLYIEHRNQRDGDA